MPQVGYVNDEIELVNVLSLKGLQIALEGHWLDNPAVLFQIVLRGSWRGIPIPFPSSIFFQIPLRNSQILFPFLIFNIFSHSQWPNPSPSGLNPIFPGQNLLIPIPILPLQDHLLSYSYSQQISSNNICTPFYPFGALPQL